MARRPPSIKALRADLVRLPAGLSPTIVEKASATWNPALTTRADGHVIEILDVIGHDYWTGGGITTKMVMDELAKAKGQPVTVVINSPGGDVAEGFGIYNSLRGHDGDVTVRIVGVAASAASIIAMAGDRIEIGKAAAVMIHNAWVMAVGNRFDLADVVTWLAAFDATLAQVYADRTGEALDVIAEAMKAETWLFGEDAVSRGYADALLAADVVEDKAAASARVSPVAASLRAAEIALCKDGRTRSEARRALAPLRDTLRATRSGTPGAADTATQDAGDPAWLPVARQLLATLKGKTP